MAFSGSFSNNQNDSLKMERDYSISVIRMFAMVLIVTCHVLQWFQNPLAFWFNLGVPIFLVISGFLYGAKNVDDPIVWTLNNGIKIIVPCWLLLCIVLPVYAWIGSEEITGKNIISFVFFYRTVTGCGHLWFISCILWCYLMTPALDKMKSSFVGRSELRFWCYMMLIFAFVSVIGVIYRSHIHPAWVLCYVLGYYMAYYRKSYGEYKYNYCVKFLILIGCACLLLRIGIECCGIDQQQGFSLRIYRFLSPFINAMIGIGIFFLLKSVLYARSMSILKLSDSYSYHIYLTHHIFALGPLSVFSMKLGLPWGAMWYGCIFVTATISSAFILRKVSDAVIRVLKFT